MPIALRRADIDVAAEQLHPLPHTVQSASLRISSRTHRHGQPVGDRQFYRRRRDAQRDDGLTVESAVVCAAERTATGWQWLHLSSQAKEVVVRTYFDELSRDVWHGMFIGEVRP